MTSSIHILIAEDDDAIREGLEDTLASEGYATTGASNGAEALEHLRGPETFDLAILDIMMPRVSGYDVCRELRAVDSALPVLMLTAKAEEIDKVLGLELGADDYMTKPFGVRELLARIHALLRRRRLQTEPDADDTPFAFGPYTVNPRTFTARRGEDSIDLIARELTLLRHFSQHPREVLDRDELLNVGWGQTYYGTTRTLDQHIAQLRKKIEDDPKHPTHILTVHGVGYRYAGE